MLEIEDFFNYISHCFLHEKLDFYRNPPNPQSEIYIQSNIHIYTTDNYETRRQKYFSDDEKALSNHTHIFRRLYMQRG